VEAIAAYTIVNHQHHSWTFFQRIRTV